MCFVKNGIISFAKLKKLAVISRQDGWYTLSNPANHSDTSQSCVSVSSGMRKRAGST